MLLQSYYGVLLLGSNVAETEAKKKLPKTMRTSKVLTKTFKFSSSTFFFKEVDTIMKTCDENFSLQ